MSCEHRDPLIIFTEWGVGIIFVLAILLLQSLTDVRASPTGHITVSRDIPEHDISRVAERGKESNVATAREDIIVDSLRRTKTINKAPQTMSDNMLSNVRSQNNNSYKSLGAIDTATNLIAGDSGLTQQGGATSTNDGAKQVVGGNGVGGAVNRGLLPVKNLISILPLGK